MDPISPAASRLSPEPWVEWGASQITFEGETVCGDRHLVQPFDGGVLTVVLDGLGHGVEAAAAAQVAIATLEVHAHEPAITLLQRCHQALRPTRGAAISLASFNTTYGTMTWLGIGNVEGVLLRADKNTAPAQESIMLFAGVAGHQISPLHAVVTPVSSGDLLILFTDGVRRDFLSEPIPAQAPQRVAEHICAKYSKGTDDSLVLVARYLGGPQ
ncbi:MAG TPA: SpoIIE family protein phosphatase [Bryobacteraceae bacterium]|nr:SpoIIE family protein phosphatase [Bryobacteraceae bacterium]